MAGVGQKTWRSLLPRSNGRLNLVSDQKARDIIHALGLKNVYKDAEIIDCNPGCGVWSKVLNEELNPKTHLLLEPMENYYKWQKDYTKDFKHAKTVQVDPYKWRVYSLLEQYGAFKPKIVPASDFNTELLVTGNFTNVQGAQLVSQFITCIAYRSWLQKFGRVRMLLWVRDAVASKAFAGPDGHRGKMSALVELFADIEAIASTEEYATATQRAKLKLLTSMPELVQAKVRLESEDSHPHGPLVLLDIRPKAKREWEDKIDMHSMEYILRNLFITPRATFHESIDNLGPGAREELKGPLGHLYDTPTRKLTSDDLVEIFFAFEGWPFKPKYLFDLGEDTLEQKNTGDIVQFL
ncbi:ribosomal RNA adenine dimethylase-domain-containing protein [Lipomyces arxii]|uniref:ribosomal RNA adenine dimethylase-domain-containing protein n=1 Tax=Lipomyces arxii TaxID=56418 RepID=UPI0034D01438